MRKIFSIVIILVLSFAMIFIYPAKQANANPLAVGGALYLGGAGVYVLGAVVVGGIAGVAGCESCQEDIEAHAARTWEGSTQLVKDGMQLMVDASVGAWGATSSALTAVDANVNTWVDSQIDGLAKNAVNIKYDDIIMDDITVAYRNDTMTTTTFSMPQLNPSGTVFAFCSGARCTTHTLNINAYTSGNVIINYVGLSVSTPSSVHGYTYAQLNQMLLSINGLASFNAVMEDIQKNKTSGKIATITKAAMSTSYAEAVSQTREAWLDMVDAGLVLPVDNARPMNGDIPLTYDPVTDAYAGIDGVNVPRENITMDYQKPHWKTLEDLAMLGLTGAGAGLYIDGWTGSDSVTSTYNPTTDSTTTTTDTTTTHTNVNTGETVTSTTSTTTTTTGDTTGNPTTGEPPPPSTPSTPTNPFKGKVPGASLLGLWELLVALIWYLIRLFTFVATLALIAPTEIDNPYFQWFTTVQILGITPYPLVQNLALFFLGFSIYKSVRRVF